MTSSFPSRREFLAVTAAAAVAARTTMTAHAAEKPAVPVVDTHTHFYDPTRSEGVPWPGKNDAFLYRPVLPPEYQQMTAPLGVVGTVVVEASPWVEDNQWILDLCDRYPYLLGQVGHLQPGSDEFTQHFSRFVKHPKWLGVRVNADPLAKGLDNPQFLADVRRLMEAGRELDVNGGPSLLPLVDRLAKELPELRIVINHLANVRIDGPNVPADWQRDVATVAAHPHVFMKVSALVEGASQGNRQAPGDVEYYRPTLDIVWQAFGKDRVIYGSNWPVSARYADYATVQRLVQEYVSDQPLSDQAKFFQGNAQRAYRWPQVG
ncbi:amidohydrolase family protein [bacterium]|nr:amidohydrolase family protein [bacterium]